MSSEQVRIGEERIEQSRRLTSRGAKVGMGGGVVLAASAVFAPVASADEWPVTKLADTEDGACNEDCSLREAVEAANDTTGPDVVTFVSGLSGTITLDGALNEIDVDDETTITGPGASVITVNGNDDDRIFDIDPGIQGAQYDPVSISGLTFTEGYANGDNGGAIRTFDTALTVVDSVFRDNVAGGGSGGDGGAIGTYDSSVVIERSVFDQNRAEGAGGALYLGSTPGLAEVETVIRDTVVTNNAAEDGQGGGLYLSASSGDVVIERSTISGNESSADGGGIFVDETNGADFTLSASTVADNSSGYSGGGIDLEEVDGQTTIANTTVSGNDAGFVGGGISFRGLDDVQSATVRNSTITGNRAGLDAGLYSGGGIYLYEDTDDGGDDVPSGPIDLSSTIVAGNTADSGPDLGQGGFTDPFTLGFSLLGNPADAAISATGPNLTGVDPQLGPLQNNGGPTDTHAPAFTSPVIDKGVGNGLGADQRGAPRTFDAANVANAAGGDGTDIGSVELLPGGRLSLASCKGATENLLFAPGTAIVGTDANDVIVGTDANDNINSGKGKDKVCAGAGNDGVKAGAGKDNVAGQAGKDRIKGNGGNDKLQGNAGKDTLKGGGGKDTLKGGGGKDKLRGGPGRDKLKGGGGKDSEVQ